MIYSEYINSNRKIKCEDETRPHTYNLLKDDFRNIFEGLELTNMEVYEDILLSAYIVDRLDLLYAEMYFKLVYNLSSFSLEKYLDYPMETIIIDLENILFKRSSKNEETRS